MSPRAAARLRSLVPFWGEGGTADVPLRTLRLGLLLAALLSPVFWLELRVSNPEGFDPLWARALLSALALAVLAASYAVPAVRDHPRRVFFLAAQCVLLWFGVLAARNHLAADYALGYCFVMTTAALLASLVWDRPGPVAAVLGSFFVVGALAAGSVDPAVAGASASLFVLMMASAVVVYFATFYGRIRAVEALEASEARLAEAERLAQTGAWSHDLATGHRAWSRGVYDVLGLGPSGGPPPPLDRSIHPDDLELCRAEMARLDAEPRGAKLRFRIVRPDGETRWVESTAAFVAGVRGGRLQGVVQDVTDRVARETELREARDQAEAANRAKSGFLANMSHEIRTPLTAIIGYAQVLQEEVTGEHAALVAPIEAGGRRLLGTLNSVLDLARLEAGQSGLALQSVDLAVEAAEVVSLLESQAERKGLALRLVPPPAPLVARADPDALGRVLANLVSNAVKFTDAGRVSVRFRETDGRAELAVADTGRGMDAAFLDQLYSPFQQASSGWARSHEGTGLGLTITHRLVEAMGGTIRVESEPGVGTTFRVLLPLAGRAADARPWAPPSPAGAPPSPASAPAPVGA